MLIDSKIRLIFTIYQLTKTKNKQDVTRGRMSNAVKLSTLDA